MAGRYLLCFILIALFSACSDNKPIEQPKKAEPEPEQEPLVIAKPKPPVLSQEQRAELGFFTDIITKVENAANSPAEPFYMTVVVPSENLKGEKEFETEKLAGFSVRTTKAEELITSFRSGLRVRGYLIFRSHKSYGDLPDIVTVVKGNNSYDILNIQGTEAPDFRLDTKAIIAWLRKQQQLGSFVITGAGADWLEARFVKPPQNMLSFARKVSAFAPDVMADGAGTAEKLAVRMEKMNGFYLVWD